jgi:hypothetical protein
MLVQVLGREQNAWAAAASWAMNDAPHLHADQRAALLQELAIMQAAPRQPPPPPAAPAAQAALRALPALRADARDGAGAVASVGGEASPRSPLSPKELASAGDGVPRSAAADGWIAATSARLLEICGQVGHT